MFQITLLWQGMVYGVTMHDENPIPLGRYRHFKGNDYSVVGFARDSETKELMVLYVPLYGDGGYWIRPLAMFTEKVNIDGEAMPRFAYVDSPTA